MFVLVWATLIFCVRGSNADTGTSQHCSGTFCITLSDGTLTAEAGLCVVIPCSFQTSYGFTPHNLVWYKCKTYGSCDSGHNIIFDSNNKNRQSEFEGRVSLLEPDVSQKNCSIIINDLRESDSGSYQLRVNGLWYGRQDGFTFFAKATVSIGGLSQKPRIRISTMTEGQQATASCIAPGLCSGSVPEVTWTWKGAGETESYISGNITSFRTKAITAFSQRHISTLTFNSSAEHHNTNVTCKIRFAGEKTTEESSTLKVNSTPKSSSSVSPDSSAEVQSTATSCTVTFNVSQTTQDIKNIISTADVEHEENAYTASLSVNGAVLLPIAIVSIFLNVIFIICLGFLWNSRKKMKVKDKDSTYMSLQKTDRSPEYDVICQLPK